MNFFLLMIHSVNYYVVKYRLNNFIEDEDIFENIFQSVPLLLKFFYLNL